MNIHTKQDVDVWWFSVSRRFRTKLTYKEISFESLATANHIKTQNLRSRAKLKMI